MGEALSVLLVDDEPERAAVVEAGLRAAGHRLAGVLHSTDDLAQRVAALSPDVVVIDIDSPSRDMIDAMRRLSESQPRPIALFTGASDPTTIAAAMEAGVSAYVIDGLSEGRVKSVVDVAVAHFRKYRALHDELQRTKLSLQERKSIERAKGLLMQQRGLTEQAAFALLRKLAMDQNKRIGAVADDLLAYAKILGELPAAPK